MQLNLWQTKLVKLSLRFIYCKGQFFRIKISNIEASSGSHSFSDESDPFVHSIESSYHIFSLLNYVMNSNLQLLFG